MLLPWRSPAPEPGSTGLRTHRLERRPGPRRDGKGRIGGEHHALATDSSPAPLPLATSPGRAEPLGKEEPADGFTAADVG